MIFKVKLCNPTKNYDGESLEVSLSISKLGEGVITLISSNFLSFPIKNSPETRFVNFIIEKLPLTTGTYSMNVMVRKSTIIEDWVKEAKLFDVQNGDYYKVGFNMPDSHRGVYFDFTIE